MARIVIVRTGRVREGSINDEIRWLGSSLGLFSLRDKDSSCYRIFIELLKSTKVHRPLSSDDIAHNTKLSRGTVMHHVNRLMESGIVITERRRYRLRESNLEILMDDLERDIDKAMREMKEMARKIDDGLGI